MATAEGTMVTPGIQVTPDKELKFRFELKKQIPTTIKLYNASTQEMAFKVKTTAPKKYCVKPNTGLVAPGQTQTVHVIMQAQREWPADVASCKDKFLVQTTPSMGRTDFSELFAKGKDDIKESKLRVSYVQPAPPPSPVPEGEEDKGEDLRESEMGEDGAGAGRPTELSRMYTSKSDFDSTKADTQANDMATLQHDLDKYRNKNESLTTDINMLNASLQSSKSSAARGFSLLHLLITAILAFLVGLAYAKYAVAQ